MHIGQRVWNRGNGWKTEVEGPGDNTTELVLGFGSREVLSDSQRYDELREMYPSAHIITCSTAGEISGTNVLLDGLVATGISFENTPFQVASLNIRDAENSVQAGRALNALLPKEGLIHVVLISDGQKVNGTELVAGMSDGLPEGVAITGGMAGDGTSFDKTLVGLDQAPGEGTIVAVGFYGKSLRIGYGSVGGWDSFGPDRMITKSQGNVLYELDGQSALALYKKYLGDLAAELPGSALLFPLSLRFNNGDSEPVVRTILSIDEGDESMTFAGDVPEGSYARLMKANFDRLIDGASVAAHKAHRYHETLGGESPDLAILISCVGRRLVLGQRTEEEVEAVREVLGSRTVLTGFYSYGEISPFSRSTRCELHNQTMTITTFSER